MNLQGNPDLGPAPKVRRYRAMLIVGPGGYWGDGETVEEAEANAREAHKRGEPKAPSTGGCVVNLIDGTKVKEW